MINNQCVQIRIMIKDQTLKYAQLCLISFRRGQGEAKMIIDKTLKYTPFCLLSFRRGKGEALGEVWWFLHILKSAISEIYLYLPMLIELRC